MALLSDIFASFRRLPLWVQVWGTVFLVPINMASLLVLDAPYGVWIAVLSWAALLINIPVVLAERGFGRLLAMSHLVFWGPQVLLIVWVLTSHAAAITFPATIILPLLLVANLISLAFDVRETRDWIGGKRGAI